MAVKTIKISGKDYNMKSSAFTMFSYKNETGRDLLKDILDINEKYSLLAGETEEEQTKRLMEEMQPLLDKVLKLSYIMIKEYDKTFTTYEEWLKDLDDLIADFGWIMEVLELGLSPFRRGIFDNK